MLNRSSVMTITCTAVTLLNWTLKTIIMESSMFGTTVKRLGDEDFMGTCTYWVASMQQVQSCPRLQFVSDAGITQHACLYFISMISAFSYL